MTNQNVKLKNGYVQVCVWPATNLGEDSPEDFEKMFKKYGYNVQYLETITTLPDDGRTDIFFAIADEDVSSFAVPRLQFGIMWIEDVLASINNGAHLYPARVKKYKSWDIKEGEL